MGRVQELMARASHSDAAERYRALEEAGKLPPAVRAQVARAFSLDSSLWVRALAESLLEHRRGVIRRRPALLHELDRILEGTQIGTSRRASLARLLEDAQSFGSAGDLALATDRAARLVTQALSELNAVDHEPLARLRTFLQHVAAHARPAPISHEVVRLSSILEEFQSQVEQVKRSGEDVLVNREAISIALRQLIANAREAYAQSIHLSTDVLGTVVMVDATNDGSALREQEIRHMFDPWFTAKEGHAGLGLHLAKVALAEASGDLELLSPDPVTFRVRLPAVLS